AHRAVEVNELTLREPGQGSGALLDPMRGSTGMMRLVPAQRQLEQTLDQQSRHAPTHRERGPTLENSGGTMEHPASTGDQQHEREPQARLAQAPCAVELECIECSTGNVGHREEHDLGANQKYDRANKNSTLAA